MIWVRGRDRRRRRPDDQRAGPHLRAWPGALRDVPDLERPSDAPAPPPGPADPFRRASLACRSIRADLPDAAAVADLLARRRAGAATPGSGSHSVGRDLAVAWLDALDESLPLAPAGSRGRCVASARSGRRGRTRWSGHKTLNYWPNRLMYENARSGGFDECVTISPDGQLWEGSRSEPLRGGGRATPDSALLRQGLARDHAGPDPGAWRPAGPGCPGNAAEPLRSAFPAGGGLPEQLGQGDHAGRAVGRGAIPGARARSPGASGRTSCPGSSREATT